MRAISSTFLVLVLWLAGCASEPESPRYDYVPAAWLEPAHIDAIMKANPRPPLRGTFETSEQYDARMRVARDRLDRLVEIPVSGTLVAAYDPDAEEVLLPIGSSVGFWSDWQTVNGYAVYDRDAEYPEVTLPMPVSLARESFDRENFGLVLVGSLHDFPGAYLAVRPEEVLIYDRRSLRVLARDSVRN